MECIPLRNILDLIPAHIHSQRHASVSSVANSDSPALVQRLTLSGEVDAVNLIVKQVTHTEWTAHSLVSSAFSHVVPSLIGCGQAKANAYYLVMEDCGGPEDEKLMDLPAMHTALRLLASVHQRFANNKRRLSEAGLSTAGLDASTVAFRLSRALDVLVGLVPVFDVGVDEQQLKAAGVAAANLVCETAPLLDDSRHTLVHGDFHFGNIFLSSGGEVRLGDWGNAGIQSPAWDLIMCSENEVAYYLDRVAAPDGFFTLLRAAVLYRLAEFITTGVALLLSPANSAGAALPLCIERFVEAAAGADFRGGRGVQIPPVSV
ncbi:MAG TPA: aminoglycoside phosphotransferase family protein [Pyrinomonadaceae bacterium]|nr:aminoglycoside phosphotransferase family protein [Pyrinomonadaceae bacterium]